MNFGYIVSGQIGIIHLITSVLALLFGTLVLASPKGTSLHRKMGYAYSISMLFLLITAFMLYNLFGKFGIFHWAAVVSSVTLLGGLVPMILKKPKAYISWHFNFMYWSVFGLYGALSAEVLTRIPKAIQGSGQVNTIFYNMVGIAVFITMGIGYYIMWKKKSTWLKFDKSIDA